MTTDISVISGGKGNTIKDFNLSEDDKIQINAWEVKALWSNRRGTAIVFNSKDKLVLTGTTPYGMITHMDMLV